MAFGTVKKLQWNIGQWLNECHGLNYDWFFTFYTVQFLMNSHFKQLYSFSTPNNGKKITSEVANTWANKRLISDHINRRLHINKATLYIFICYLLFLFSTLYDFCLRNMTRKFAHFSQLLCHTTCTYWAYAKIARIIFMCSTWNSDKRHVRLWRLELHLLIFALIIPYVNYSTKKLN